ncbi:MAG: PHB depolymerase family esterase [Neisseria sp.]|nr:PHB depolymerase family esterase [Neisseria sp.]
MLKPKLLILLLATALSTPVFAGIKTITAISESTSYGQKVTAAAVEYDETIKNADLDKAAFSVAGRTVTGVYATDAPNLAAKPQNGRIVMVKLSPDDADAGVTEQIGRAPSVMKNIVLDVSQTRPIQATWFRTVAPESGKSSRLINEVVDEFTQHEFTDPATGIVVKYNLYTPKDMEAGERYPLVMFIHDAGSTNTNVLNTLLQGNGATVWAEPSSQAKQKAFVLAPQYDHEIVNDKSDNPPDLDPTINLIKSLTAQHPIDTNRLYATGQSGGGMMSIALNIKYPDFFAASYLVASQWAADKTPPMAKNKLFILVSQDDTKAYPGENAITAELEKYGAKVGRAVWNGNSTPAEFASDVQSLLAQGGNIHYAAIKSGTLPAQLKDPNSTNRGQAHRGTWEIAYNIEGIRDWLYRQHK